MDETTKLLPNLEKANVVQPKRRVSFKFGVILATVGLLGVSCVSVVVNVRPAAPAVTSKVENSPPMGCQAWDSKLEEVRGNREDVDRIIQVVLNGTRKGLIWRNLARFVDKFGPRPAGSQALEDSIDYLIDDLKRDGQENVGGEEAKVPHWVRGEESAYLVKPRVQKLQMLGLGPSVGTPSAGITAQVVVVSTFDELRNMSEQDVKGKIVVYNQDYEGYGRSVKYRRLGAVEAAKKGAVASLVRSITPYSLGTAHTGWQDYEDGVRKIPTACISVENAEMLYRLYKDGDVVEVELKMEAKTLPDATSRNVVAEIVGTKYPEQVVMLSGHLDSWDVGQGAIDDAGGAFISFEALNIIRSLGLRPKRTLRAIGWTGEETGVHGANQYASDHKKETGNWSMVMESDMGTFKPVAIRFSGINEQSKCIMSEVAKFLAPIGASRLELSSSIGPDVLQWTKTGIPGSTLVHKGPYFNYHHSDADTMSHLSEDDLELCTVLWTVVAFVVANMEEMLPR